jgi:cell division protein FtsB
MSTRWMLVVLACLAAALLGELFLADDGYRKTLRLRTAVAEQRALNAELRARNEALDAEVVNLKEGRDAAEERARTDLGLIGPDETFYQVVTRTDSTAR